MPPKALIHAAAVGVLATAAADVLVTVVLPNYAAMFGELKAQLPFPTRLLIAIATLPQLWPPVIVAVGVLAALATFVIARTRWQR